MRGGRLTGLGRQRPEVAADRRTCHTSVCSAIGAKILGPTVGQRCLGATQRVGAVGRRIEPDLTDPTADDSRLAKTA